MKSTVLFLIGLGFTVASFGNIVNDTLFINKDTITVANVTFQVCVFNDSTNFKAQNFTFEIGENDTLQLHVINNDTLEHTFTIDGVITTANLIAAGGTADFEVALPSNGPFRYYSDVTYGRMLGASGVIIKGYSTYSKFYWNMFEQSGSLSYDIVDLTTTSTPISYTPDVFTINFNVPPALNTNVEAKVFGNVGDTLLITVVNSGQMEHTLHFHGYHVEVLKASKNLKMTGWEKDTFPIELGEVVFIRLVPDQPGIYPVHEHNLINVTSSGSYPGGMLNLLDIQP